MSKKREKSLPLYEELLRFDEDIFERTEAFEYPEYIESNLVHTFRDYQEDALRFFHHSQTSELFDYRDINHVLFNMATGSGKTDLMAGLILYLFKEHNYQNFLFIVNTKSVLNKTIDNLLNHTTDKYLYSKSIEIDGNRISFQQVKKFPKKPRENTIYIKLDTVQAVANDIYTVKENSMGAKDYAKNKLVVLGDEAHHYSASTKKEKENEQSWESAINTILHAREDNLLLEFTATIDLDDPNIYEKYKNKIIYRYTLDRFIADGYSKNIRRIQTSNSDLDNMLNTVLLSQYRKLFAREKHNVEIKPVILFKSQRIGDSNDSEQYFNKLIASLTPASLTEFITRQMQMDIIEASETLELTFEYFISKINEFPQIIREIKRDFGANRVINANDSGQKGILERGQYEALNSLESPTNLYRVIFAVAKLTEGWDVLNLHDIVRISDPAKTTGSKKATNSEAQLIGRGARYNPFKMDNRKSFTRRFEEGSQSSLLLETLHYHTINEPQYLKNLVDSLDAMNLPTGEDTKNPLLNVKVKPAFKRSNAWKSGKIYYNEAVTVTDDYYDGLDKYGINNKKDIVIPWIRAAQEVKYSDFVREDYSQQHNVIVEIDKRYLNKAMNRLSFYHFENLKTFLPKLSSRDEFYGEKWLNLSQRTIYARVTRSMAKENLKPEEKLKILEIYLQEVAQKIQLGYQKVKGTNRFVGYPIKDYIQDYRKRIPQYDTGKETVYTVIQNIKNYEIKEPFFIYDSAVVNLLEKELIERVSERVSELEEEYDEVYLIRMDENMHRESRKRDDLKLYQFDSKANNIHYSGFQPDFILYLENSDFYMQIFIEPKGTNLLEKDQWKEDVLTFISQHEGEIIIDEHISGMKIKGVKFYTKNDGRKTINQIGELALGKSFKGLSME